MHRFRVISYTRGETSYYETKIKTWFGWVSFSVFYKTDIIHILSDPSVNKTLAYERINHYCQIKGYLKKDIEISEIIKSSNKMRILLRRIYSE